MGSEHRPGRSVRAVAALAVVMSATLAWAQDATTGATPAATPAPAPAAPAAAPAATDAPAAPAAGNGGALYTVVEGSKVDDGTFEGWKTWRSMACERCHGATQDGLVGPSLNKDLKTMSKADFVSCVMQGKVDKGMPNFGGIPSVAKNIDNLYAYLKGRSDGAIAAGHLHKIGN